MLLDRGVAPGRSLAPTDAMAVSSQHVRSRGQVYSGDDLRGYFHRGDILCVARCNYRHQFLSNRQPESPAILVAGIIGGLERAASYSTIETGPNAVPDIAERPGTLKKYTDAAKAHLSLGSLHLFIYVEAGVMFIAWLYFLLRATGPLAARCSLVIVGIAFFIVPVFVFPMQYNYLVLTSALFPLLLGLDMAGIRTVLRNEFVIPVLLVVDILCVLPSFVVRVVQSVESRVSYKVSLQQASTLRDYLSQHPSMHNVVLVPTTHYFLYKDVADEIYNPNYLSASHDPDHVGAVVNCFESTKNFVPGTPPLPDFVNKLRWRELSAARDSLKHYLVSSQSYVARLESRVRYLCAGRELRVYPTNYDVSDLRRKKTSESRRFSGIVRR